MQKQVSFKLQHNDRDCLTVIHVHFFTTGSGLKVLFIRFS